MYIKRHLEGQVLTASKNYPVVMVCGQRQVGKSTMLYHIKENDRKYVTLDDINARRLAEKDVELFFETYGYKLIIDEFQRVPSILLEIKKIVDERALKGEDNVGMFWLTGSQKFRMMKGVSESLAGRVAVFDMSGLTQAEINGRAYEKFSPDIATIKPRVNNFEKKTVHEIYENIFRGGLPKLLTTDIDRERYYADYINTYLERDVKDLSQVGKLNEFYNFLVFLAARTAQELKYDEVAKAIGVSAPTVKAWVAVLERSGIIILLKPYASNLSKTLVKTPKIYFMDTGLCASLCRWKSAETLENGAMDGAILETYIVSELIKNRYNGGFLPDLYYYRDTDKKEVDIIIPEDDSIYPIEIKKSKNPFRPTKNFETLAKLKKDVKTGLIICFNDEFIPFDKTAWCYPIWMI